MVAWAALAPALLRATDLVYRGWIASRLVRDRCPATGPDPQLAELQAGLLTLAQRECPAAVACPSLVCPAPDHLNVWLGILIYFTGLVTGILIAVAVLGVYLGTQRAPWASTPPAAEVAPALTPRARNKGSPTPLSARSLLTLDDCTPVRTTPSLSTASTNVGSVGDRLLLAQLAAGETRR
jgi:hypothetical protein